MTTGAHKTLRQSIANESLGNTNMAMVGYWEVMCNSSSSKMDLFQSTLRLGLMHYNLSGVTDTCFDLLEIAAWLTSSVAQRFMIYIHSDPQSTRFNIDRAKLWNERLNDNDSLFALHQRTATTEQLIARLIKTNANNSAAKAISGCRKSAKKIKYGSWVGPPC